MPPGRPPKRARIVPSRFPEATFSVLNFDPVLGSILAPFWLPKWLPFGTLWATKTDPGIARIRVELSQAPLGGDPKRSFF